MKLSEFLLKRALLQNAESPPRRLLCLRCRKSTKSCLCHYLRPFHTQSKFTILMHPMEAKKERVGTGRLSHLCLTNSKIIIDEKFDHHHEVQDMLQNPNYQNYLLYPGKCSHNLDHSIPENFSIPQKERNIFVLDGTWSSAKSMMRDSLTLHQIPRISFDPVKSSEFFIKRQPSSLCLSTIESIYHVLESLNKWNIESLAGQHGNLLTLLNELCQFQDACASNPSLPRYRPGVFKKSKVMKQSKKWLSRKIYFE